MFGEKEKRPYGESPPYPYDEEGVITAGGQHVVDHDVFGNEEGHSIRYKTLSWQMVAVLMIAEIVSNGMLSLPSSSGVVGVSRPILEGAMAEGVEMDGCWWR